MRRLAIAGLFESISVAINENVRLNGIRCQNLTSQKQLLITQLSEITVASKKMEGDLEKTNAELESTKKLKKRLEEELVSQKELWANKEGKYKKDILA